MGVPDYVAAIRRTYGRGLLLLPGVSAVVVRRATPVADGAAADEVLLVRRTDNGRWSLPSGIVEPGQQPAEAITREVLEETRVSVRPERLALLSTDPPITYPNGDQCQFVAMTFRCAFLGGVAGVGDEESTDVRWFHLAELPVLDAQQRRRLSCGLAPVGPSEFDLG